MGAKHGTLAERLWRRVDKTCGECWLWLGSTTTKGHGHIGEGGSGGRLLAVHRVSWEIHHGPVPSGMNVLHRCDIPNCVNPVHLFLGTVADNNEDRDRKGRAARVDCENHPRTKLTNAQAKEIYRRAYSGHTINKLAAEFGVSKSVIKAIRRGRSWKKVTGHV